MLDKSGGTIQSEINPSNDGTNVSEFAQSFPIACIDVVNFGFLRVRS